MKVVRVFSAESCENKWLIEVSERDFTVSQDAVIDAWRMLDKIGEHFKVPPFCPCGERPHRIHCPLGFAQYFPRVADLIAERGAAPVAKEGRKEP